MIDNEVKKILKFLKPYKVKYILLFLLMLFDISLGLFLPFVWGKIVVGVTNVDKDKVMLWAGIFLVVKCIKLVGEYIKPYMEYYIRSSINHDIRIEIYRKMLQMPVKAFDDFKLSQFVSRVDKEVIAIPISLDKLAIAIMNALTGVFIIGILFSINKYLALITIATFPVLYWLFKKYGNLLKEKSVEIKNEKEHFMSKVHEGVLGIRDIKSLGIEVREEEETKAFSVKLKDQAIGYHRLNAQSVVLASTVNFLSEVIGVGLGIYLVLTNALGLEYLIAYRAYSIKIRENIKVVTSFNLDYQQLKVSISRIMEILENNNYVYDDYGSKDIEKLNGSIEFKNVDFSYDSKTNVLSKLDLYIRENRKVAIVGKSGSGKSTIFNLLLKFYTANRGKIEIGGYNINDLTEDCLRNHISVVRQDIYLFGTSIRNNLKMVKANVSDEEIEEACKKANIHDYIMSLKDGYDTIVDEGAETFSGGQKQRIAVARALLKNSKVMLFDEATSALDNVSQKYINEVINEIKKEHTIIIVAHRLENIKDADEIFVIDEGKVVAKGKHEDLLKQNEIYRAINLEGVKV